MGSSVATLPDLAGMRASKGISLQDIACATKITLRYLQAIERGEFEKLPGGVYNVNYIRQYARCIDIDESGLLDFYHKVLETTD